MSWNAKIMKLRSPETIYSVSASVLTPLGTTVIAFYFSPQENVRISRRCIRPALDDDLKISCDQCPRYCEKCGPVQSYVFNISFLDGPSPWKTYSESLYFCPSCKSRL